MSLAIGKYVAVEKNVFLRMFPLRNYDLTNLNFTNLIIKNLSVNLSNWGVKRKSIYNKLDQ